MTKAGGVDLPGEVGGLVALDEVLIHGWDLARATEQAYRPTDAEADAVLPIVTPEPDDPEGHGRAGLLGRWSRCPTTRRLSTGCSAWPAVTRAGVPRPQTSR